MERLLPFLIAMTVLGVGSFGCQQAPGDAILAGALAAPFEVANISTVLQHYKADPTYQANLTSLRGQNLGSFLGTMPAKWSDAAFTFDSQSYSGLKKALTAKAGKLKNLEPLDQEFASMSALLGAAGASSTIGKMDLEAYVTVAEAGLKKLGGHEANTDSIDLPTMARALHVAVALQALPIGKGQSSAALLDSSSSSPASVPAKSGDSTLDYCGSFAGGTSNSNWLCLRDNVNGSIGYMSASQSDTWVDAFNGNTAPVCPAGVKPSSPGSNWGWIPDPSTPGKGKSCHGNDAKVVTSKSISDFCNTPNGKKTKSQACPGN